MINRSNLFLLASLLLLGACVTEGSVDVDQEAASPRRTALEFAHQRVARRVAEVRYQSGKELLATLTELVGMKEVALQPILDALPAADPRTKANLLYVLSFLRNPEAHQALVQGLSDENTVVRYEAASGLLSQADLSAVPVLIGFLESEDRRLRYKAFVALSQATGEDCGFHFNGDAQERAAAVGRWREWWQDHRRQVILGSR